MLSASTLSLIATAAAFAASSVDAHGYVYQPAPTWTGGSPNPGWITNVDYYWEEVGSGGDQCGIFKTMSEEKGMSVRDVVLDMAKDSPCGNTLEDGTKQDIPSDGKLIFAGNGGGGFTHQGPCEIWFDDTLALRGDNCENEYPGGDVGSTDYSEIPVDYSKCSGDCILRFYWLAFQNEQWQSYINCIPLKGGSGSSTTVSSEASSNTTTSEAPETTAPATTEAPAMTTPATTVPATEAPVATTAAPVATTAAPVATTAAPVVENDDDEADEADATTPVPSCKARQRRRRD